MTILSEVPTSTIVSIVERLHPRLFIDFGSRLPAEICLKILGYLDPVSLINIAKTCRNYYSLAVDSRLWEALYHQEGWKAIRSEINKWEAIVNSQISPDSCMRNPTQDADTDMSDAEGTNIGSLSNMACRNQDDAAMDYVSPAKNKGKGVAKSEYLAVTQDQNRDSTMSLSSFSDHRQKQPIQTRSTLWVLDPSLGKYRLNWRYLYSARRKLEANWEAGAFSNFQLPHPDYPEEGHTECVYNLQYDSEYLVSGSRDKTLRIWNLETRRLVRPPLSGHRGSVLCLQFDSNPAEDLIVSGSSDSNVIIWRFSTGEIIQRLRDAHTESVLNVKFDHRVLVTCSKDKTIKIFNRRSLRFGDMGYPRPGDIHDGSIEIVDPVANVIPGYGYQPSPRDQMPVIPPYTMIRSLEGHSAAVNAVQILDDEVVSASGDRHIKVWNWPDRTCRRTLVGHTKGIACVQYDGRRIVSGSNDCEVKVFDKETSLEVASLRAHSSLVRTVQSGFGDLPYSMEEDKADAKAVESEFFKAVKAGIVLDKPIGRRDARNAGSRRPQDIIAYGAKLPPGGGGGKYGRIVSGSYDQTIIIWRRDKDGWRAAHTLHQIEAAAVARRVGSLQYQYQADGEPTVVGPYVPHPSQPSPQHDNHTIGSLGFTGPQSQASFHALIDSVIPQGATVLASALSRYPSILNFHPYIQMAIGREPNPWARNQLRQVVATAMVRAQMATHLHTHRPESHSNPGPELSSATPSTAIIAHTNPSNSFTPQQQTPAQTQVASTGIRQHIATAQAGSDAAAAAAAAAQPNTANQVPTGPNGNPTQAPRHPHMAGSSHNSTRIFKLQFDARRIVCSSQASVIVGWDFCNGDSELEEASRFFAPIN